MSRPRAADDAGARSRSPMRVAIGLAVALGAIVLIAGAAYGAWYLFLKPAGPAAVAAPAIPSATSGATESTLSETDGTWTIDPSIGSFDDFSGSFVGYRVQEELASIGGNVAVGRTPDVSGQLTLEGATLTTVDVTADLTTLQSDDERRDGQLGRQGIQTDQFPTATFTLTEPIDLDELPADGDSVEVTATGELTLHGVTQTVRMPITATLSGNVIGVTGSLDIDFADYGISPPSSFMVLSIDDHGTMELQLFFRHD